ncbi:MAG: FGGY-family carbohydrate kinase [Myxococcales bacterium]|nr:FGGY-family carbohydrate kinase [Myxococcales bacterium]
MTRPCILAIDLGTSGPKVALVGVDGVMLGSEFEPTALSLLPGGGAEQDPEEWWRAIVTASRRLIARALADKGDVVGVCCTSMWSSTVAVDRDGVAIGPAINWMDSRGAAHLGPVFGGGLRVEGYNIARLLRWIRLTGGAPTHSGKDSLAHILFLKHERPDVYARAHKFLEPKDYLNVRLTGEFAASFDSIALCWVTDNRDLARVAYDPALLDISGIDPEKLPALRRAVDVLGPVRPEVARELGIGEGALVVTGTPDLQSAALGSGATRDFEGHLYVGTSSWITCHVPFKKTSLLHNMGALPSAIPGRYFIACEQECAGKCLSYLRDTVFFPRDPLNPDGAAPEDTYARFDAMAESVPAGSDGLLFLPWLYGERTPVDDHSLRGGFFHQSLSTTRAHMIRAVLEGVALNARWLLGHVEGFAGRKFGSLNFIGGGARSRVWCQIFADVLGHEIRQLKAPLAANVRGAGFLGAVGLGHMSFDDLHARVEIAETFTPDGGRGELYDLLFDEFLRHHRVNRRAHARLARVHGGALVDP